MGIYNASCFTSFKLTSVGEYHLPKKSLLNFADRYSSHKQEKLKNPIHVYIEYFELEWTDKDYQSPALNWIAHMWTEPVTMALSAPCSNQLKYIWWRAKLDIAYIILMLCLIKCNLIWITWLSCFSRESGVFAWCSVWPLAKQSVCKAPCELTGGARSEGTQPCWMSDRSCLVTDCFLCTLICVHWSTQARQREVGLPGCWARDGCTSLCSSNLRGNTGNVQEGRHSPRGSPQQLLCCCWRSSTGWATATGRVSQEGAFHSPEALRGAMSICTGAMDCSGPLGADVVLLAAQSKWML